MLEKLFNRNKESISTEFNADQIKPIFDFNGIDIETIGFPFIKWRNCAPLERYLISFKDVTIKPVKIDENISVVIEGKYTVQAEINRKDGQGNYYPGYPMKYNFKIKNGKLELKEK